MKKVQRGDQRVRQGAALGRQGYEKSSQDRTPNDNKHMKSDVQQNREDPDGDFRGCGFEVELGSLRGRNWILKGFEVHYEYMALAKKTSVLREAMLCIVEPRCFLCPAEYAGIC